MTDRDENGRFIKGNTSGQGGPVANTHAQKHGGAGAVKALTYGEPFRGLAAVEEQQTWADLEEYGRAALVERQAVRLETAAGLYWSACLAAFRRAGDDGGLGELALTQLRQHLKTFGWLAAASLRAWKQVGEEERAAGPMLNYDELVKELQSDA